MDNFEIFPGLKFCSMWVRLSGCVVVWLCGCVVHEKGVALGGRRRGIRLKWGNVVPKEGGV